VEANTSCFPGDLAQSKFSCTFLHSSESTLRSRNERFVSHAIIFNFWRQLFMNDPQQRPWNFAPKRFEDAHVSTQNAASDFLSVRTGLSRTEIATNRATDRRNVTVLVFSVACGFLSLAIGASSTQCQDMVAEPMQLSSSSQRIQLSELLTPTEPSDLAGGLPDGRVGELAGGLPDAPQTVPMNSGGPAHPPGMGAGPLLPQTFHDKFMAFAVATIGPRALVGPAFPAAIRMANPPDHFPAEWRQGAGAFGRNYGDQLATVATLQTGRFVAGAALHEDFRYHSSTSTNFFLRTGHAIGYTFVDRSDDGQIRPALANYAGVAGGSYVGMSYLPLGFNDVTHANQTLVFQFSRLVGSNLGAEFGPDIFRFLSEHHLPRPKIPIPEWWVKQ
jgi:hypothetical protein